MRVTGSVCVLAGTSSPCRCRNPGPICAHLPGKEGSKARREAQAGVFQVSQCRRVADWKGSHEGRRVAGGNLSWEGLRDQSHPLSGEAS